MKERKIKESIVNTVNLEHAASKTLMFQLLLDKELPYIRIGQFLCFFFFFNSDLTPASKFANE